MSTNCTLLLNIWPGDDIQLLADAADSIIKQKLHADEILVISDGPVTKEQFLIMKKLKLHTTSKFRLIEIESSQGLWKARNLGLSNAKTKYVALMDADDVMHPERLKIQLEYLKRHPIQVLGTAIVEIDSETKVITGARRSLTQQGQIVKKIPFINPINHPTVILDREFILEIGGYRDFYLAEDYELWSRVISNGGILANLPEALLGFHINKNLFKRRGGLKFVKSEIDLARTLRTHFANLNILKFYLNLCFRMAYRLMPWRIRKFLHLRVLGSNFVIFKNMNEAEFLASAPISI